MDDNLDIADRCRAIFDLCDDRNDGFIDVNRFKELVKTHYGFNLEVVTGVISLLDPEGKGLISFDEFSQGVEQIRKIQRGQLSRFNSTSSESFDSVLPPDLISYIEKQSSEEDSAHPVSQSTTTSDSGSDVLTAIRNGRSTKTTDSGIGGDLSSVHSSDSAAFLGDNAFVTPQFQSVVCRPSGSDDGDSVISGPSEINENSRPDVTDEESYEAFGEVESEADASDPGLTPVVPRKRGEKKDLLQAKSSKKLCLARLSPRCGTPTSTGHSSSEEVFDNIDENFSELHGRVKHLESQLLHLTKDQVETKSKQVRLKDDNSALLGRVVFLEEQLRDMELQTEQRISEERRSHQEHMARRDREKCEEVDYVKERLRRVEKEYDTLKEESLGLRHEISRLRSEKLDLQERMLEKQEMYNLLYDDHEQLKTEYHKQEELHQKERKSTGMLVDELGKELEEMRRYKHDVETGVRKPGDGASELPGRYLELQDEIHKLKRENQTLRDSNEDLNAQLVTRCVAEGKSLLDDGGTASLAEELDHLTKEELLQKLGQEQEYNQRLKQYIDRMLLIILEKSPSILEINEAKS